MATDYTTNYHLDKYTALDKPNLRDQYNAAMDKIDLGLLQANQAASSAVQIASGFQEQIEELVDTVETELSKYIVNFKGKNILCFGDSLTNYSNITKHWPDFLRDKTGCTIRNYAVGGAAFTKTGSAAILTQIQNAINASSFNNDDITDVFIIGGYNDYASTPVTVKATALNCITTAKAGFKNAVIHVGGMLHGTLPLDRPIGNASATQVRSRLLNAIQQAADETGCAWIFGTWFWCVGRTEFDYGDGIHTNTMGQEYIAGKILSHLCGGSTDVFYSALTDTLASTAPSFVELVDIDAIAVGGTITVTGRIRKNSNQGVGGTNVIANLPAWCAHGSESAHTPATLVGSKMAIAGSAIGSLSVTIPRCYVDQNGGLVLQYMENTGTIEDSYFFHISYPFGL